jgi:hypothetical protein
VQREGLWQHPKGPVQAATTNVPFAPVASHDLKISAQ